MSSNVLKGTFIRFSGENTRVIDSQDLVKKRMDAFSGVLRERENNDPQAQGMQGESYVSDDVLSALTGDSDADEGFKEISFAQTAEHIGGVLEPEVQEYAGEEPVTLNTEDVRRECEDMIAKANQKADEIRAEARIEGDRIREDAKTEGYSEGLEAGRAEGLEEYNAKIMELEAEKEAIYAQYNEMLAELEPKMVESIVSIYRHVFGNSLYSREDVIVCLLNRALSVAESDGGVTIYVSSQDYEEIVARQNDIIAKTALHEVPNILVREDLSEGQAKIETSHGIIDCGIDTELSELEKALLMLAYERRG